MDSSVINWILFEVDPATLSEMREELQMDAIAGSPPLASVIRNERGLQAACVARVSGNLSARLECFRNEEGCERLLAQCVDELCEQLRQRDIGFLQCMLPNHARTELRRMPVLGFEPRAEIAQLCLNTRALPAEPAFPAAAPLRWLDHTALDTASWKHLLNQTLLDSQDLAGIGQPSVRGELLAWETQRLLQHHLGMSRILCQGEQPLGLFVLRQFDDRSDLVYVGVALQYRQQRLGGLLLEEAVRAAAASGSQYFTTMVDMKNLPARRLFARLPFVDIGGFQLWERSTSS
ncbi:MAG: GNAT family N-acetyltransferase [bacterium]|nr:GNAT family N-acetyltransferase [bacterium]